MRVAVTGASGFLGRHVLHALSHRDVDVVACSRRPPTGADSARRRWVALDVADFGNRPMQTIGAPELLIHLAWDGLPNYRDRRHLDRELPDQIAFLDACLGAGLPRLAVSGTCLEYGLAEGQLHESLPARPVTCYAQAKHLLHQHLLARHKNRPFGLAWFRLFYLHGPGQAEGSLLPQLERAIRAGATHFDMSPGDQTRDFTPVAFAADALVRIALAHTDPGVVNLCSGRGTRVIDLVRGHLHAFGSTIEPKLGVHDYPDYEPRHAWGDRRRMDALLEGT